MTDIRCDAIKSAYRQSKDGYVVSFVIHPQDMPALLANADIGSQWQLTLVELDEDGNAPVQQKAQSPEPGIEPPARARRPVAPEKRLAQRAGILCADQKFWLFLIEKKIMKDLEPGSINVEKGAAISVRDYCRVNSRSEIVPGTPAGYKFEELLGMYEEWQHPEWVA